MGATEAPPARAELLEDLLRAALEADQRGAMAVVERALNLAWTVDDVRFDLVTPVLYDVGRRWERAEIGVAEEHLATSVCEWVLFHLGGRRPRPAPSGRRAVVGCSEGELHTLGARIVGHVLVEHGWRVLFLGASTPAVGWSQVVRARRPEVAVVCTTTASQLASVPRTLSAIKTARPECRIVAGGQAYWSVPDPDGVGADVVALDGRALAGRLDAA
jgi:methanogenic corrinoid protein MtbC1